MSAARVEGQRAASQHHQSHRGVQHDSRTCRLCWGDADSDPGGELLSPCGCRGSLQWIHRRCLQEWRGVVREQGFRRKALRCEVCGAAYRLHGGHGSAALVSASALGAKGRLARCAALLRLRLLQLVHEDVRDPLWWATAAHVALRAYIATTGVVRAAGVLQWALFRSRPGLLRPRVCSPAGQPGAQAGVVLEEFLQLVERGAMYQVYVHSSVAAIRNPPVADAYVGLALGAVIASALSELLFLPLLGVSRARTVQLAMSLLGRCSMRLWAAGMCSQQGCFMLWRAFGSAARGGRRLLLALAGRR